MAGAYYGCVYLTEGAGVGPACERALTAIGIAGFGATVGAVINNACKDAVCMD